MKALVVNGPNLNMLGIREPGIYGKRTYDDLVALCKDAGARLGFAQVDVMQSNHEGAIIDAIQQALGAYDGIVINPAAYTHTSVDLPAVEVHISDVSAREDFRQVSYARLACFATVMGEGLDGYVHALELLRDRLSA